MIYENEFRAKRVKELEERISRNKFINDYQWRERGEQVIKDMAEIKYLEDLEIISQKIEEFVSERAAERE